MSGNAWFNGIGVQVVRVAPVSDEVAAEHHPEPVVAG